MKTMAIVLGLVVLLVGVAAVAQVPDAPAESAPRVERLCGISLWCADKHFKQEGPLWQGLLVLPQASLGLVRVPFERGKAKEDSYREALGTFTPTIGGTAKWWFLLGWFDAHVQVFYGKSPDSDAGENYLWGLAGGAGLLFSVFMLDFYWIDRRVFETGDAVDSGGGILISIDLTGAGVLLGTAVGHE
jgi:hypothetical protein